MTLFSDVERHEAIEIVQLLVNSNRVDLMVPAFRQGMALDDVRQRFATEAAPTDRTLSAKGRERSAGRLR